MGAFRLVLRFYWLALLLCIELFDSPKLAVAQELLDETVRDGVQLLDERDLGNRDPHQFAALRCRSRHRIEYLSHHPDRRGEHGDFSLAGHLVASVGRVLPRNRPPVMATW